MRTHVNFARVSKIEAVHKSSRVNVKIKLNLNQLYVTFKYSGIVRIVFSTHPSRARNNQSSTFSLVHQWCPRFSCKYSPLKSTKTRTNRNSEPKTSRGYTIPEKEKMTKNWENTLLTSKRFWLSKFLLYGFIHWNLLSEWIVRFKFLFGDHFINSHNHFSWQRMDIVRRKLMLVTIRT